MTFGTPRWGSADDVSEAIFNQYVEAGGNFIDTADVYAKGRSEELVGEYVARRSLRDQLVLATKSGFNTQPGNPHGGGNGRKHVHQALDASLRRLKTDYVDLYWAHVWDGVTPAEELLQTMGDLVRSGKIRYYALSDVPAWFATQLAMLAQAHGVPGPVALQLEYSLVSRTIEYELLPAARALGLGVCPWSPLAAGFLAGKYEREDPKASGEGRLSGPNPFGDSKFTEANWRVLDVLRQVAAAAQRPLAQVALAWVQGQPGVASTIIGASRPEQIVDNLAALDVQLTPEQRQQLDEASAPPAVFPYGIFSSAVQRGIFGGHLVKGDR
jgi:aryl-alcohol dehydrogenase-like predicted oxidoreductase